MTTDYKIVPLSVEFPFPEELDGKRIFKEIEEIARTCYKSEEKIKEGSDLILARNMIDRGHWPMFEFHDIRPKIVCDRGVSHEWVRHRLASYAQESTRYCDYSKGKFGRWITVIQPLSMTEEELVIWREAMSDANRHYKRLRDIGSPPGRARSVLPLSLKTEMYAKHNLREWRHFFRMRCANSAHEHIRFVAREILKEFKANVPLIFDDLIFN